MPRLEAFKIQAVAPDLVPGTPERAWMERFTDRHAYRCLPLSIANCHCWDVLAPVAFEIRWTGGMENADLTFSMSGEFPGNAPFSHFAQSNFSRGVATFHTGYL